MKIVGLMIEDVNGMLANQGLHPRHRTCRGKTR